MRAADRRPHGSSAEREELLSLRRENKQLRLERDILSRATAWFARETAVVPVRVFEFMSANQAVFPSRRWRACSVCRAGYHAWRHRPIGPRHSRRRAAAEESGRSMPVRARLMVRRGSTPQLRAEGQRLAAKRIARLMRAVGWSAPAAGVLG